jgi:hypothetical protein
MPSSKDLVAPVDAQGQEDGIDDEAEIQIHGGSPAAPNDQYHAPG